MSARIYGLVAIAALLGAGWLQHDALIARLPLQWNPWAPYDVNAPEGPATSFQYWRTTQNASLCRDAVHRSGLQVSPIADFSNDAGCSVHNAFEVHGDMVPRTPAAAPDKAPESPLTIRFNHAFIASCPVALAMARFDHRTVIPASMQAYGQPVREITHVGSYACRPIRTERTGSLSGNHLSEHAYANAIDVTGFVLADGRQVTVEHDWMHRAHDSQATLFLHALHEGACDAFHTTLGPDYNALHKSHFHLDMGRFQICR